MSDAVKHGLDGRPLCAHLRADCPYCFDARPHARRRICRGCSSVKAPRALVGGLCRSCRANGVEALTLWPPSRSGARGN